jgi:hypothetical protein
MDDADADAVPAVPEGVRSLQQLEGMRREQGRAMAQLSEMVRWYGKKAKRFREMVLWERTLPEHSQRKNKNLAAMEPERDDPPEIDLLVRHRRHHDRLERAVDSLEKILDNPTSMEPKDYADACKTLDRLAARMLGHLKEIGEILSNVGRESATRENNMARMATEVARLNALNAQHNDRMALVYDEQDPDRMTNADLNKILADAEAKKAAE